MNLKNKKIKVVAVLILIALNVFAFYFIQEGIGIAEAIKNTESREALAALKNKQILSDVVPSLIFTVDIVLILFLLYLLVKATFKTLKKPTSTKS